MKNTVLNNDKVLIGLSKKEVVVRLGNGFNFYPDNQWSYILKRYWYGRKKVLYIDFDAAGTVIRQSIESKYGRI
ncbi:hypothetical protein [Chryseobacterium sp. StRB126]|uniref:hypothetical protein n=1 Tax=Chryseobacterium sp. StRB126 TaxID=878220 RepID=UPI0005F0221A|nr:hypothetical protein [Chryseobacterium sp. StRB126]